MALLRTIATAAGPPPPVRRSRRLAVLILLFAGATAAWAQTAALREYQLKAVFLFNFAQFVEWPSSAYPGPGAPLVIGVLGEDPFGTTLDDAVRDEMIGPHPLVVQRYRRPEEIGHCHILFISHSETGRLEQVLARLRERQILTVSDAPDYAARGVMIRLITAKGKIRLRINLDAAKAAGLVISSKLLRPAEIITSEK